MIQNTLNNKVYVGKTKQKIGRRFSQHKTSLNKNKHENQYLQN